MSAKPIFQTALYIPVILGLIIFASIALRWSLADVYGTQVSHHLDTANRDSSNKNAEQWRLARRHLDRALELRPAYARYFELAENFYQKLESVGLRRNPLIRELEWHENEPKALDYARRGLHLTPSWPYLWNRLVMGKLLLKQVDNEVTGAIERAVYLGPWERSVQYSQALLGLNFWPMLSDTDRSFILQAMKQTWLMDKKDHKELYDIKKMLSHPNCPQEFEKIAKGMVKQ